ncbi:hypothetical protein ACIQI8_33680 [Streptomyces sp. NPDC092369]|uniref:hypothetical protein n=1 Tax=Streptomyces sp. NPDC092369 TaxID=3366015 RepID=UPI003826CFB3
MTQSGQGEEPSARQPREGIVLPSDGGEPLLPGMAGMATPIPPGPRAGSYDGRQDGTYGTQHEGPSYGSAQQDGSYGAQPGGSYGDRSGGSYGDRSGGSYGGDRQPGPYGDRQGDSYPAQQSGSYGDRQSGTYGDQQSGTYGDQQAGSHGAEPGGSYGDQQSGPYPGQQPGPYGGQQGGSYAGGQQQNGPIPAQAPPSGQAWGTPWGPDQHQPPAPAQDQGWAAPQTQTWGSQEQHQPPAPDTWGTRDQAPGAQPLPDADTQNPSYANPADTYGTNGYGTSNPSAPLPPAADGPYGTPEPGSAVVPSAPGAFASPLPPAVDEGATQFIPPVPAMGTPGGDEGATQFIAPVPAAPLDNEGATQLLPPVGPGALPPEVGGPAQGEETRFLGRPPQAGAGPLPPATGPDAQATQYIPPVTDQHPGAAYGERQPPAEFDNLFRSGPGGVQPAPATQQLPRFAQPQAQQPRPPAQPYAQAGGPGYGQQPPQNGYHQNSYEPQDPGRGGRSRSRVPLIAAVGIGIVVLGVGAGALLGGGSDDSKDKNQTVSATAPVTDDSSGPSAADPAKAQAVALDKLLSDSGASRASVIKAVSDVKGCDNLGQAASNLRDAAKQRTQLVTRLSGLSVDKLANHDELTSALTQAWQASASADNHYAAWADQTAGKKGCRKGQARTTGQTQAGNRDSGTASAQKAKAAQLWNAIAKTYGLTQRQPTQL